MGQKPPQIVYQAIGDKWQNKLLYHPLIDGKESKLYSMSITRLQMNLQKQINLDQQIEYLHIYKTPLSQKQVTDLIFHHQFIVFKSQNWWWSFQKVADSLILQRSDKKQNVIDKRNGKNRCNTNYWKPQLIYITDVKYKTRSFIKFIQQQYVCFDSYNLLKSNCKHFVQKMTQKINRQTKQNISK